jgi:hypothetical protein
VKEKEQQVKEKAKMKRKGFTHLVTAWIHPSSGDDYQVDIYYKSEPSTQSIQKTLKAKRSQVLTDYQVHSL